jgi:hypothetical protein
LRTPPRTVLRKDDECDQDVGEEEEEEEDAIVLIFVVVVKQPISLSLWCVFSSLPSLFPSRRAPFCFLLSRVCAKRKEEKNF